jgi:valyl-tRNA synthetase
VPSITITSYPEFDAFNEKAEAGYDLVLEVVKSSRSLLAQYGILKNATIIVSANSDEAFSTVSEQKPSILSLVKAADTLEVTRETSTPPGSVVSVVSTVCSVFVVVKGHVNFDEEISKAEAKIKKTEGFKATLLKQTSAPDYETKVKQEVREINQKKLETMEAEIAGLQSVVATFQKLKLE